MRLRAKLVLAFVLVIAATLSVAGYFVFDAARETLTARSHYHLSTIAVSHRQHLEGIIQSNFRVLNSVSSRLQLRRALRVFTQGNEVAESDMRRILTAAMAADPLIRSLTILDGAGDLVLTVGEAENFEIPEKTAELFQLEDGRQVMHMADRLSLDGADLGTLLVEVWADEIVQLTSEYTGLGDSGEIVLAKRMPNGDAMFLIPLRFDPNAAFNRRVPQTNTRIPINRALDSESELHLDLFDYRDVPVLAVTGFLPGVDWGIVVKIDKDEALAPVQDLQTIFVAILLIALLIAIATATILARNITKPLQALTQTAEEVSQGQGSDLAVREANDEVGILSRALKTMLDKQRESAGLLKQVMEMVPALIAVKDRQGHYLLASRALAEMYKETPESITGKTQADLHPNLEEVRVFNISDEKAFQTGIIQEIARQNFTDCDGNHHILHTYKVPFDYEDRSVLLTIGMDMTRQVLAEDAASEAETAAQSAQAASEAKSNFLATMSHELRSPLSGILGYAELLRSEEDMSDSGREYLNNITNGGRHLLDLIGDILDYTKIESGKLTLETIPFNIGHLAEEMTSTMAIPAKEHGSELVIKISDNLHPWLLGDPTRLRQIMMNFLSNAIKFTKDGTITLSIELRVDQKDRVDLRLAVADTGIGIPADKQGQLFDSFTQTDGSITREYGGTGLGLAISKRLAEAMGGRIGVESTEGVGSIFWFDASFEKTEAVEEEVEEEAAIVVPPMTILLAEDIDMNRVMVARLLEKRGHSVVAVADGQAAVAAAGEQDFDLILMDIHMPRMDGVEALKHIRKLPDKKRAETPTIALTADVASHHVQYYLTVGMLDCVSKPVNFNHLDRLMAKVAQGGNGAVTTSAAASGETQHMLINHDVFDMVMEAVPESLELFRETYMDLLDQCETSVLNRDWPMLMEELHALKGVVQNMGFERASQRCRDFENNRNGLTETIAQEHLKVIRACVEQTVKEAERQVVSHSATS